MLFAVALVFRQSHVYIKQGQLHAGYSQTAIGVIPLQRTCAD
jgi:hypothetical protein